MYNLPRAVVAYLWAHKWMSSVALYFLLTTLLGATIHIDICIPCLWKMIFGISCPGCGVTTAYIHFMKMDFVGAFQANKLFYIILSLGLYILVKDFRQYKKRYFNIQQEQYSQKRIIKR